MVGDRLLPRSLSVITNDRVCFHLWGLTGRPLTAGGQGGLVPGVRVEVRVEVGAGWYLGSGWRSGQAGGLGGGPGGGGGRPVPASGAGVVLP